MKDIWPFVIGLVVICLSSLAVYGMVRRGRRLAFEKSQAALARATRIAVALRGKTFGVIIRTKDGKEVVLETWLMHRLQLYGASVLAIPRQLATKRWQDSAEGLPNCPLIVGTCWAEANPGAIIYRTHVDLRVFDSTGTKVLGCFRCAEIYDETLVDDIAECLSTIDYTDSTSAKV